MYSTNSLKELIFTSPAWTIATMLAAFAIIVMVARPLMAVILSAYALIIGVFFPGVDLDAMTRLIHHLSA